MNTMNDTPRTDASELRASDAGYPGYVHASLARTLERENTALRAEVDKATAELSLWRDGEIVREEDRNETLALRAAVERLHDCCAAEAASRSDEVVALRMEVERLKNHLKLTEDENRRMHDSFGTVQQRAERAEARCLESQAQVVPATLRAERAEANVREAIYMLRTGATKEQLDFRLSAAIDAPKGATP